MAVCEISCTDITDIAGDVAALNASTINGHHLPGAIVVSKGDVGLGNVPNVNCTNPANIVQDSTHRFVTDAEKAGWVTDHGALTGLADDDHTQYLLLAGRTGQIATTPLKLGGATDHTLIEADGTVVFEGAATVWEDMRVPGTSARLGASAPAVATFLGAGGLYALQFNGTGVANDIYFEIQMSHKYKEGTDIHPHVHWTPTDTNTGNVVWYLEYSWANIGATFGASTTITTTAQAAGGTAWVHKIADFPAITGTGKTISSMLVCRLYRDPADVNDTYAHPATFLEFDLHFEIDTVGSRAITTK